MKTFVIAEAGVNHNGSLQKALRLVDIAADAGASAVKFQTFTPHKVISVNAPKAEYQKETTDPAETQLEMVRKLQLSDEMHYQIKDHCEKKDILFISSPFDEGSVDFLIKMGVPIIKVPSGEITNAPLLMHIAKQQKDVILSTGMSTLGDIEKALGVLAFGYINPQGFISNSNMEAAYFSQEGQQALQKKVSLLHCTTEYPASFESVNLRTLNTIRSAFNLPVGLSDHTPGITVAIAAVALGATIIEKHFTIDKKLPGPDHRASLEPAELCSLIQSIRQVEAALGTTAKIPATTELNNRVIARKCLVASCEIRRGEKFSSQNITCKRSGKGLSPFEYWCMIGKEADRDYKADDPISLPE